VKLIKKSLLLIPKRQSQAMEIVDIAIDDGKWAERHPQITAQQYQDDDDMTGPYHYKLFDAAETGDYKAFMEFAEYAAPGDLNWCADVVADPRIAKYINEHIREKDWLGNGYVKALKTSNKPVIAYMEKCMPEICLKKVTKKLKMIDEYKPHMAAMFKQHGKMLKCRHKKRNRYRKYYAILMATKAKLAKI
jgi:hypothetical protein